MSLMKFSHPFTPITWPLTILWPPSVPIAVPGELWTRRPDGFLEAVYLDKDELALSLQITQWIREPGPQREQSALLPMGDNYYAE